MAHMYPETLVDVDVSSPAELRLFHAFRQQLSDQFYIFHSVAWLGIRKPDMPPADGEADFVLVHAKMGILVLEVKGGFVGFDPATGWYSVRKDGAEVKIKNPVTQVKRNKHALIDKLKTLPNWQGQYPTVGHAIAFPDGTSDLPEYSPEMPSEIVLLHGHLQNVDNWVRACLKFWAGTHFVPPDESGVLAIRDVLRRSWLMREPVLGEEIGPQATAIHRYTLEQFRVLDWLAGRPRAAIRGIAGSGKTMLAIEKARRLAREGFRTLLTCYNSALAEEIRSMAGLPARLKVQNFHALCEEYAISTGRDQQSDWTNTQPNFFDEIMPEALADAAATGAPQYVFDAIIVDEGQDFKETWWLSLQMLLKDPNNGILYIFYDDNQLVYHRTLHLPVSELPYALTTNCRNTRQIHQVVAGFYKSDLQINIQGPEGRPVVVKTFGDSRGELRALLTETLSRLIFAEHVRNTDVVVLSPGGAKRPPLDQIGPPGAFSMVTGRPLNDHQVQSTTIRLFKGLQRPVIVLVIPGEADYRDELLYVGLSRACNYLEVLLHSSLAELLLNRLDPNKADNSQVR